MKKRNISRLGIFGITIGVLAVVGVACGGGGVSDEDFSALRTEVATAETQLQTLTTRVQALQAAAMNLLDQFTNPDGDSNLGDDTNVNDGTIQLVDVQERLETVEDTVEKWPNLLEDLGDNVSSMDVTLAGSLTTGVNTLADQLQRAVDANMASAQLPAFNAGLTGLENEVEMLADRLEQIRQDLVSEGAAGDVAGITGIPGGFLERALNREFAGTDEIRIFGPCRDQCAIDYNLILDELEKVTGLNITYDGSSEFETEINTLVQGGNAPDIVDFPQPGLLQSFVSEGLITEVTDFLDLDYLNGQYNPGWVELSTLTGPDGEPFVAGVWSRTGGTKSLVWYAKDDFDAAGYEIPETFEELVALTDQIRNDGATPWCIGIESGVATGWVATDWTEDLLLRTTTLENYDNWTVPASAADRLLFDSPEVRRAIELWSDIWFTEGNVRGGRETIVSTSFGNDSTRFLFDDPPGCYLHRNASFVTGAWVQELGAVAGEDFDVFYFPNLEENGDERPFLTSGDLNAAFNDRPEVLAVLEFHSLPEAITTFIREGGDLSPFSSTVPSDYGSDTQRTVADLLKTATSLRFDGSDLQPATVGAGAFWNDITEYIAGNQDLDTTVMRIDAAWPAE